MNVIFYKLPSGRSPVEGFIEDLSKADQARFAEVIVGLTEFGLACSRVQFKPLRGKLWEIKFSAPGGEYRKSTQKTPLRDLELAEKRMKEVLNL